MFVKIARSKHLINKGRFSRMRKPEPKPLPRCNHCGGLIRLNGEIDACIMCSREMGHVCATCAYTSNSGQKFAAGSKKKSA